MVEEARKVTKQRKEEPVAAAGEGPGGEGTDESGNGLGHIITEEGTSS